MPRDLFGDVSDPSVRVGSQSRYTVTISLAAHLIVIVTLVIVPLMAGGVLPDVRDKVIFIGAPPAPEPPPPPPSAPRPERPMPVAPDAAPIEMPTAIRPETGLEVGFENDVPGLEGAVPGLAHGDASTVLTPPPPPPPPQEPVRVGGKIAAPTKVKDVAPIYPAIAQAARVEGVVVLQTTIDAEGRVIDVKVVKSTPLLDQVAVDAVRQWQYSPTLLNGVAVPVLMTVTVRFGLR